MSIWIGPRSFLSEHALTLEAHLASLPGELSVPRLRRRLFEGAARFPEAFYPLTIHMAGPPGIRHLQLPGASHLNAVEWAHLQAFLRAEILNLLTLLGPSNITLKGAQEVLPLAKAAIEGLRGSRGEGVLMDLIARLRGVRGLKITTEAVSEGAEAQALELEWGRAGGANDDSSLSANSQAEVVNTPRPPRRGWLVGVDIGGTDVKILVIAGGRIAAQVVHPWTRGPHTFHSGEHWLPALTTLIRFSLLLAASPNRGSAEASGSPWDLLQGDSTAADLGAMSALVEEAIEGGLTLPMPRALGLAFPDIVVGDEIVGGITGKTRGMEAHLGAGSPAYWSNFNAFIRPLPGLISEALGGVPVFPLADGAVAAVLAGEAQARRTSLAISLGTSVAVGLLKDGDIPPYPLYGSHLILSLGKAPWSAHDTTGILGVAQKGPTQKGLMAMAGPEGPFPKRWAEVDAHFPRLKGGALNKARVSHLLAEGHGDEPLFQAMGEGLGDLVAEVAHCLPWSPSDGPIWLYGRLLEGPGGGAILGVAEAEIGDVFPDLAGLTLRPAGELDLSRFSSLGLAEASIGTFGQALGAAFFARDHAHDLVHPLVERGLEASVKGARAVLGSLPYAGYDAIILSASTAGERRGQEAQFDALFKGVRTRAGRGVMILSIQEEWQGGAGNLLGTLHALEQGAELATSRYGVDLMQLIEGGDFKVALIHNGGAGKRCSPLVQSENNSRGSIRLPGTLPTGEPLTLLTAVALQAQALAASNGGGEVDVIWSSQLFFGIRDLAHAKPSPHLLTKFGVTLAPGAQLESRDLKDLGLFALDPQGSALDFFAQGTFSTVDDFAEARRALPSLALDLGSFRIKLPLIRALNALYASPLRAREGKRDLDPDFTQPLVALIGGLRRGGVDTLEGVTSRDDLLGPLSPEDRHRFLSFPTHGEVLDLLLASPEIKGYLGDWVGLFDIGPQAHWWRMRRPFELYALSMRLLGDISGTAPSLEQGGVKVEALRGAAAIEGPQARAFFGIEHPITRSYLGDVFIEGPEVSFEAMAKGVFIGGVRLRGAIVAHSRLLQGSSVVASNLMEVSGEVDVRDGVLMMVSAPKIHASRAYVYRRVERDMIDVQDQVEVGAFRPSAPRGLQVVMASAFSDDGKTLDGAIVPPNSMSFKTLREELLPGKGQRLFRVSEVRARRAMELPALDLSSPTWRCFDALADDTGLDPRDVEAALTLLRRAEPGSLDPVSISALAKAMASSFMAAVALHGTQVLPRLSGSDEEALSASARGARGAIDVLAQISARPESSIASRASGPLFGGIIEGLNDTLRPDYRALSARVLYRIFSQVRRESGFEAFDGALEAAGIHDEAALAAYHRQVRNQGAITLDAERVEHIAVLPRVTVGAEIAIGSALVRRLLLAFPEARISYLGARKLGPLFEGEPRLRVVPFAFPRRGGLRARLEAWVELRVALESLKVDLVVGPDSRGDQVGILPVVEDPGRYLYWENTMVEGGAPKPMAGLLDAHLTRLGLGGEGSARPTLWPRSEVVAFARGVWSRLALEGARGISIKYDVGGLLAKSLGPEFEEAHFMGVLASGDYDVVVFDRGFGDEELARSGALLAKAEAAGYSVVSVTDLGRDGVGFRPSALPDPAPSPRARILAFHGTIGGWGALSLMTQSAFSYDSVHQHLAAADRILTPGAEPLPGSNTVVAFAGYPTPWFPQLWAPVGRGRIEVIRGEGVPWRATLARVLGAHRRMDHRA